jgi:ribosomal protection tetracycline resistance protein
LRTLNLGVLAHVDAGKTSLTERLLHAAGVIGEVGSVDDGTTQTDSLALEQKRGITIKSAVASIVVDDVAVNLIDTPGHPDFVAEVERSLSVLDGAVLVVSAVEGVQAQTRVLMRALKRLRLPTLIFVNKIDRSGAQCGPLLQSISEKLTPAIVPMGSTSGLGTRGAGFTPYGAADGDFTSALLDLLADHDDALLARYVRDEGAVSYGLLRGELAAQTKKALVHPVFFGSAMTGAGVDALISGIAELLPAAEGDPDGPVSGTVFKVERGPAGEKIAYVRVFSGTVRMRDRLRLRNGEETVTAIEVFEPGSGVREDSVAAGQIGRLHGLGGARIGDAIGEPRESREDRHFSPPTLEAVVVPRRPEDRGALRVALDQLAEQDPLIAVRQDDVRQELYVSLYGEVQKEVIGETLADEFGVGVEFRDTTTVCVERPVGTGEAVETIGEETNPFLATVGLRVEPAPIGAGVRFGLEVELGTIPLYVYKAVEEFRRAMEGTVQETLQGGLYGWRVTDCAVTMTRSGYWSPVSTARDFRLLTPLVLMDALKRAGTVVCEPVLRFHLEAPADTLGTVLTALARLGAAPRTQETRGASQVLEGEIPAARVRDLQGRLAGLTRGEGVLECDFDVARYRPVEGRPPTRSRTDNNPLNRKEYLLRVARRA